MHTTEEIAPQRAPYRILVIEDDLDIAGLVALNLAELPAEVVLAHDGRSGLMRALEGGWDALVLDLRLPGMDGLDLCRALRAQTMQLPILMLTARASELDRVLGLELGADDYLTKPFSVLELRARMRALLRRSALAGVPEAAGGPGETGGDELRFGGLRILRSQRRVWLDDVELELTPREFDLLWFFAQHPGQVFTRAELLDSVWGYSHDGYDHTVNSHINRLRSKLGSTRDSARYVHTVWGVGYRFEAAAS